MAQDNFVATSFSLPAPGSLVLIVPNTEIDPRFSQGEKVALKHLTIQLRAAGLRVAALDRTSYDKLWAEEVSAVGGIYNPTTGKRRAEAYFSALSALSERVCQEAGCTLLISHRLVARQVTYKGEYAAWDGQRRKVQFTTTAGKRYDFRGTTLALSVELTGLDPNRGRVFVTYGGASLPYSFDALDSKADIRDDLFKNELEVSEAVRLALMPVLPKSR
jgi:hypothetical protein